MKALPGLCLDFDGVIHWYRKGWSGADVITDEPTPGAIEALREYVKHFTVHIYSGRSSTKEGRDAMMIAITRWHKGYCDKHGIVEPSIVFLLRFPQTKPGAMVYMDDRGFRFEGKFPSPDELKALFKTWTGYKSSQ